jgi:ribonuclease P protein component
MRLSRDFDTAVRRGRRAGRRTLVVHAAVNTAASVGDAPSTTGGQPPARVGLIVSRAVGSAVTRNRVKRRLRAAMSSRVDALPPGALVVLRANPPAGVASGQELTGDLDSALRRVLGLPLGQAPRSTQTGTVT